MDIFLIIIGVILLLVGIIGCFLPVIPGPPLGFLALLVLQFNSSPPFATKFMVIMGVFTVLVTLLDYVIPAYGAKKWGGSKKGITGAFVGVFAGLFFPPMGLIIFPIIGALLGEILEGKSSEVAFKSALGTFLGILLGTLLKFTLTVVMAYYFFKNI